jgi:hypothetical protein
VDLIIPLGIAALAVLLSYQMPVYMARLIGQEAALDYLWMAAWYDSIPTRVLFVTAYMLAGFLSWAGPVVYIVVALFDPRYGPALRQRTVRALVFLTIPLTERRVLFVVCSVHGKGFSFVCERTDPRARFKLSKAQKAAQPVSGQTAAPLPNRRKRAMVRGATQGCLLGIRIPAILGSLHLHIRTKASVQPAKNTSN